MKTASNLRSSLIGLGIATLSLGALAQSADEHKDHHPTDTASAAKPAPKALAPQPAKAQPSANDKGPAEKMGQMDAKMKTMQDMHEKFMAAKTPEELVRRRLTARAPKVSSPLAVLSPQFVALTAQMLSPLPARHP